MSESLLITNGNSDLENAISTEPVVNNIKETLPDSSTGNDSECTAGTISLSTFDESNEDIAEVVIDVNGKDHLDDVTRKIAKKDVVGSEQITKPSLIENETIPMVIDSSNSLLGVPTKVTLQRVRKKSIKVVKTRERIVRNVPRRTINGIHPRYAPVGRQKRSIEKPEGNIPNGINELNISVDHKETINESSQDEQSATDTELHNAVSDLSPSVAPKSKQGSKKTAQLEISVTESDNEQQNLESEASSTANFSTAQAINLPFTKKGNSSKKIGLSHFQIMRKVLNKKALYGALMVDQMFECPICHVRKQKAQYLLLHLKGHTDLTQVFERFQAFGGLLEEIERGAPDLPKQIDSHNIILPKTENPNRPIKKVILRRKKSKLITSKFEIPILPVPEAKMTRKKKASRSDPNEQLKPAKIEVSLPSIASEMPPVEPVVDPLLQPCLIRKTRKRKLPSKRISKRWPAAETYEEPPDDVIVDVKKSRLGISHTRALDPELLDYLKEMMREKVTEENPHKCKFCGKMFIKGQGIYAHYFKHSRAATSPMCKTEVIPEKGPLKDLRNGDSAFDDLIKISDNEDAEKNKDTAFLTLQELETNVNRLLRSLVKDMDVLRNLGWPERRVSDLVIDILERCSLQPAYCGVSRLSQLQCLRKNMGKLFRFCIKEEAMERYGWDIKLVDIVVREMIATEECMNLSRI